MRPLVQNHTIEPRGDPSVERGHLEHGHWAGPERHASHWRALLREIEQLELEIVRQQADLGRRALMRPFTTFFTQLGNGWLYPALLLALPWLAPDVFFRAALAAGIGVGAAHLAYPPLKRYFARPRPCDAHLPPLLAVLDSYSFPSGHMMTVTCVAVPLIVASPDLAVPASLCCLLIGWSRILAAHHYPSDVVAGAGLGILLALPATLVLL